MAKDRISNYDKLHQKIEELKPGTHLCCIYESKEDHQAVLTPFLREGLERGEKVLYIVDALTAEEVLSFLRQDGREVKPYLESGQLAILTADQSYLREGAFDPDGMICLLKEETRRAVDEGYSALRVTGEMTWALRGLAGSARLIEYEAKLNEFFPDSKCLAICQYDRRRFEPEVLLDVLTTHPIAIVGTEVFENFYYMPPEDFLGPDPAGARLDNWLGSLADKKQAEEGLRESEERFRQLSENVRDAFWLGTAGEGDRGKTLYVNPAFEEIFGIKAEKIYKSDKAWVEMLHEDDRDRVLEAMEEFLQGWGEYDVEYRIVRGQGAVRWIWAKGFPIKNERGEIVRTAGIARDITDRKRAEDELHKLSRAVEQSPASVVITDSEGTIEYVNPKFVQLTGYTSAEAIGKNPRILKSGRQPPEFYRELWERITRGEEWRGELVNKKKNGDLYWEFASISPIRSAEGVITHFVGVKEDITERKLAEEELRKAHDELERRVEQRTAELAAAGERLRRSREEYRGLAGRLLSAQEEARRRLARELHDDLSQRLAVLAIEAARLEQHLGDYPDLSVDGLRRIKEETVKLSADVHAIARQLHPSILDDLGLVDAVASACSSFSEQEGIRVGYEPENVPRGIAKDVALSIYRIVQEGLANIAKHARATEVQVSLVGQDDTIHLSVKDNGVGFDPKRARKRGGLGLASMKERVHLVGGKLAIKTRPAKGTEIRVQVPLSLT